MMEIEQNAILEYGPCVWSCLFLCFGFLVICFKSFFQAFTPFIDRTAGSVRGNGEGVTTFSKCWQKVEGPFVLFFIQAGLAS